MCVCVCVTSELHSVWCMYREAAVNTHTFGKSLPFLSHVHMRVLTYACTRTQQQVAGQVLTQFKEHPESWTRVDTILELSNNQKTKVRLCSDVKGREEGREGRGCRTWVLALPACIMVQLAWYTCSLFIAHCVHHRVWVAAQCNCVGLPAL